MSDTLHVSSLLITAKPDLVKVVAAEILAMSIAEIAHTDELGKIIVVLETPDESAIVSALSDIQIINGVVSAALVFHQTATVSTADEPYRTAV